MVAFWLSPCANECGLGKFPSALAHRAFGWKGKSSFGQNVMNRVLDIHHKPCASTFRWTSTTSPVRPASPLPSPFDNLSPIF